MRLFVVVVDVMEVVVEVDVAVVGTVVDSVVVREAEVVGAMVVFEGIVDEVIGVSVVLAVVD